MMRFFDRAWVNGELDDEEWQRRLDVYQEYWDEVVLTLPERVRVLGQVSIHDAKVCDWQHSESQRTALLELVIGDLQRTYSTYRIEFHESTVKTLPEGEPEWLMRAQTELLYDEIEQLSDGRFEWRVLAWPQGELAIGFSDVSLRLSPATSAAR